ncbi:Phospholipase D zeta 1, partial [Cucurbita argyrosperma subsp. sororia]
MESCLEMGKHIIVSKAQSWSGGKHKTGDMVALQMNPDKLVRVLHVVARAFISEMVIFTVANALYCVIRSVSQWSAGTSRTEESIHIAYCSLIEKAEHFVYIEGGLDDSGAASVRAIMHWQYRTICRGQNSIFHNLYDLLGSKVHDYISFYGLRSYGKLFDGGPVATSQVYVHSKIMIVDDCIALIGSANINDRSLLGSRDSEIAIVIEDKELINSYMGGQPWKAGKFCWSLRLSLWSEHLGLRPGQINQIVDPVSDSTYKDTWMGTAKTNTTIYQDVFSCLTPTTS